MKRSTKLDGLERVEVTSRAQWRAWLKKHHRRTEGIWLVRWKVATPTKHVSYAEVVDEALCFGWIDSLPRKLDAERTMLYLSPRKPRSVWSKLNKAHIVRLEAEGRMTAAGRAKVDAAKADGSWNTLDAAEALEMPADLARALDRRARSRTYFDSLSPSARKMLLTWIGSARTAETRKKRIKATVDEAAQGRRAFPPATRPPAP